MLLLQRIVCENETQFLQVQLQHQCFFTYLKHAQTKPGLQIFINFERCIDL